MQSCGITHSFMLFIIVISSSEMLKPHMVEIESRDRHYKRMLFLLHAHGCNMNVNGAFFHVILYRRFLRLKSGIK